MKLFKKAKLALALSAAAGALAVTSQTSAVNLSTDGIGEVAIAPYYTTNDGWQTLINLTNTTNKPIVVKVRVHEGKNSRDVYDYNVALSARDVYAAVIKRDDAGNPMITSTDSDTCTIPQTINGQLSPLGYSGTDDNGEDNADALYNAGSVTDSIRLGEGYIEFIVMGYTEVPTAAVDAVFAWSGTANTSESSFNTVGYDIENHHCGNVEAAFTTTRMTTNTTVPSTQSQFGEPINALKFNFRLLNPGRGIEVGNAATTWANFFNATPGNDWSSTINNPIGPAYDPTAAAPSNPLGNDGCTVGRGDERRGAIDWNPLVGNAPNCMNLMTSQEPYDFLEPSLNDAYPSRSHTVGDGYNGLPVPGAFATVATADVARVAPAGAEPATTEGRGIDAVSHTIQRSAVVNEWTLNPTLGAKTDWIITMPTKGFYVDAGDGRQFARVPGDRDEAFVAGDNYLALGATDPDDHTAYAPFAEMFGNDGSCNDVSFEIFDRAENQEIGAGGVIPSPAPAQATTSLCWEANVLTFNGATSLLGSNNVTNVPLPNLTAAGATNGWMRLDLTTEDAARTPARGGQAAAAINNNLNGGLMGLSGMPVIGMMVKQRTFGDVTKNYASSLDHAYERSQ